MIATELEVGIIDKIRKLHSYAYIDRFVPYKKDGDRDTLSIFKHKDKSLKLKFVSTMVNEKYKDLCLTVVKVKRKDLNNFHDAVEKVYNDLMIVYPDDTKKSYDLLHQMQG